MVCKKCAEEVCGCETKNAEWNRTDTAYFVIDNSGSTSPKFDGHFKEFQGAALKAIDRTRNIKKFVIVPMNGQTPKEAFDKKTAKEIVKQLKVGGGTHSLKKLLPGIGSWSGGDNEYDTYVFTDAPHGGAFKAEFNLEESTVEEPDWIPDGDGRAIGQQNFGINLSPLHAETYRDDETVVEELIVPTKPGFSPEGVDYDMNELKEGNLGYVEITYAQNDEYAAHQQGYDDRDDESIGERHRGRSHCADCKCELNSKTHKMDTSGSEGGVGSGHGALCDSCFTQSLKDRRDESKGMTDHDDPHHPYADVSTMSADVGTPSPTFNEDITGQDGPSESPTNSTFEARYRYGPQYSDMESARKRIAARNIGDIQMDRYLYSQVPSKRTGELADKYYYVALTLKGEKYYVVALFGGSNRTENFINVLGGREGPHEYANSYTSAKLPRGNAKERKKSFDGIIDYRVDKRGYKVYMPDKNKNMIEVHGAEMYGVETLEEIEGPTAEATTGGLHAPSSFAMTWEDGSGQSSASIPPNEIAWAEDELKILTFSPLTWLFGIAAVVVVSSLLKGKMGEQKAADNLVKVVNKRKGCCGKRADTAHNEAKQQCVSNNCTWMAATSTKVAYCECDPTISNQHGIQNQLDGGVTFQSEFSVGQINPIEVEGQNDVYGAEEHSKLSTPQLTQPHSGPQTTYRQNARRNLKMW